MFHATLFRDPEVDPLSFPRPRTLWPTFLCQTSLFACRPEFRAKTSIEREVETKKNAPLDESSDQLDLDSQEAITLAPETQEVDSTYVSLQREVAVMPDLGFGQDTPGVDEVKFLKKCYNL